MVAYDVGMGVRLRVVMDLVVVGCGCTYVGASVGVGVVWCGAMLCGIALSSICYTQALTFSHFPRGAMSQLNAQYHCCRYATAPLNVQSHCRQYATAPTPETPPPASTGVRFAAASTVAVTCALVGWALGTALMSGPALYASGPVVSSAPTLSAPMALVAGKEPRQVAAHPRHGASLGVRYARGAAGAPMGVDDGLFHDGGSPVPLAAGLTALLLAPVTVVAAMLAWKRHRETAPVTEVCTCNCCAYPGVPYHNLQYVHMLATSGSPTDGIVQVIAGPR